jgi:hypothetical protein
MAAGSDDPLTVLAPLVGEWRLAAAFGDEPMADADTGARVHFEWMPGERFLIQRWTVPIPEAPDGIAIIGPDPARPGAYLQHYFDERGVARVYKMGFGEGVWTLERDEPDFSPFDFAQRFTGKLEDDGAAISGRWEIRHPGQGWERDFDLTYTKVR